MTGGAEPSLTLPLNMALDVHERLQQLGRWQAEWAAENAHLNQRLGQLDLTNRIDVQQGAQITRWQQRLRMTLVHFPLEISAQLVRQEGYLALRNRLAEQFSTLTKAERLLWLQNFLFIMTPDLRQLDNKLHKVRGYRSLGQQRNFLLGGPSGMGKSTYLDWFTLQHLPSVQAERNHVPVIKIDAPVSNHTAKPLLQRMILECGLTYNRSDNEEDLLMKLGVFFQHCGTELLIVDEIEHLTSPTLRRRLLEVSNLTRGIPIVCASCHPIRWVQNDLEIAGRWNDYFELQQYTGERLQQLLAFLELLLPFSQPSFLPQATRTDPTMERTLEGPAQFIEQKTSGILRDIMVLVTDASTRAIQHDLPNLSFDLLQNTWQAIQTRQVTDFLTFLPVANR